MNHAKIKLVGACMLWSVTLVGCTPSEEEMAAMLKQPPRPTELDRLEAFVGTWNGTAEVEVEGVEAAEQDGKLSAELEVGERVVEFEMEEVEGRDELL